MEELVINSSESIYKIQKMVSDLKSNLSSKVVPKPLKDAFVSYDNHVRIYTKNTEENTNVEVILKSIENVALYALSIAQHLDKMPDLKTVQKEAVLTLLKDSQSLRTKIINRPSQLEDTPNENFKASPVSFSRLQSELKELKLDFTESDNRQKNILSENESRVSILSEGLKSLEAEVSETLQRTEKLFDDSILKFNEKEKQIDEILSHATGETIAGDFAVSAVDERTMANNLRYASILCMVLIVIVVGYSFWETTTASFKWESSVFRIVLAILLSVPAAYLARESAKHREQQYNHLQTSLDLKSITPYLASLPDGMQHDLKVDIANRIFATKNFSKVGADPYPLNMHEILMELIKKLDISKDSKKADTNASESKK
jgi:hypothetical protein